MHKNSRLIILLALVALLNFTPSALAEDVVDPPRVQTLNNASVSFVSPEPIANHDAETNVPFRFKMVDAQGQPVSNRNLTLMAIRDYSGQVKKEHNGPRTPNIGPISLVADPTKPGEYTADIRFTYNGHWYVEVTEPSLSTQKVRFRTPIGVAETHGAGLSLDWLTWFGVLAVVAVVVVAIGRKGEVFPVPHDEIEAPLSAPRSATAQVKDDASTLATSGSSKK